MSSFARRPTMVSASCPSLKSNSVGMPRTAYRPGTFGFSSTFSLATVARPSNSDASASTVGDRRRQGPHHSAQKSTSTTPLLVSSSKLLSVNVFTFSDAIESLLRERTDLTVVHYYSRSIAVVLETHAAPARFAATARSYTLTYSRADASHEKSSLMPAR